MAGVEARIGQAVAAHRQAAAIAGVVGEMLTGRSPDSRAGATDRGVRELADRLRVAAALLAPEWLGAPLELVPATTPLGIAARSGMVRVGTAYPIDDVNFPVVVPLGHLAVDGDARDPRVAGMLRSVVLRLLANEPPGALVVRVVDAAGGAFAPFASLLGAGVMAPPVADRAGLCAVLAEAEEWVRDPERPDGSRLLVVASWPQNAEPEDLGRFSALAAAGPAAGLHLLLAGWPPLLLGEDSTEPEAWDQNRPRPPGRAGPPLPYATRVALRNPYALVGHPPGESFAAPVPAGENPSTALNARVFLDGAPPDELIGRVCGELSATVLAGARGALPGVLPEGRLWNRSARKGLETQVGHADGNPVTLRLADATPHWLILGGPGSGKTALLLDILYGLCGQYGPEQLRCYLLDFSDRPSFAGFVPQPVDPSYLPHGRAVEVRPDRAAAVAVLRTLAEELSRRLGVTDPFPPRLLCMIDEVDGLLAGEDALAGEAAELLAALANDGGGCGIHLVLAGRRLPPEPVATRCRVRIALPGGTAALEPANRAADELTLGSAVVNTASGLGGPPRVTRAHEQRVRFPDPRAHPVPLAGLRYRLWRAAGGGS